ncbi:MAG TPA: TetR/AcrR family transcriptional regulator [Gammaproteobacteria bacterium]|nr:TetR/AcrR family transcriptional regulator [Gammaproteobacteria bacterium]
MSPATQSGECGILAAARDLFARLGYDAVSMSMIAAEAGVSKANLYHHFGSKDDLYFAVLRDACDDKCIAWSRLRDQDVSVVERLRRFAREHLQEICTKPTHVRLIMREVAEHSEHRGRKLAEEVFGSDFGEIVALFKEGQARGELDADVDPAFVAGLLLSANLTFFQWRDVMRHMPTAEFADDPAAYADGVVEVLLHGIAKPGADAGVSKVKKSARKSRACTD